MSVLVLNRNPLGSFPYNRWLEGYDGEIVVMAPRDRIELMGEQVPTEDLGYTHLEVLDTFEDERSLMERAFQLAETYSTRYVVTHRDSDLLHAARLREVLNLPGPWVEDVLPFRDKVVMKAKAMAAGIEVADHTVPSGPADVARFAQQHGYPIVVKRRQGYSSIGMSILDDRVALERFLAQHGEQMDWPAHLVEAFVPGRMCHVDGLVIDDRTIVAWPSQYLYSLSTYQTDRGPRVDLTLGPEDPLTGRLLDLTEDILAALRQPGRMPNHAFHAEIFHTADDRLVLCEIAARPGGAKVREVIHALFGVDLAECVTRATVGLPLPALAEVAAKGGRPAPACMAGQVLLMKRPGLVKAVPSVALLPWLVSCSLYVEPGRSMGPATGSADFMAAAVGKGADRAECESRLRALGEYLLSGTKIDAHP